MAELHMSEETTSGSSRRRTFLKSLAAVGVGSALGSGRAGAQTTDLDDYHRTLRDDLTTDEGLPEGEFVYATTEQAAVDAFTLEGGDQGTETEFDVAADVPITLGDRVEIDENPDDAFAYTYKSNITDRTVDAGDVLLAVAYIRGAGTPDPGTSPETQCEFKYQYTDTDGNTSFSQSFVQGTATVSPASDWRRYYFPIEVTEKPDGSDHVPYLEFWTGFREQTIEFGGVALVDYSDTDATVDDLPVTEFDYDYPGRAEDAAWRSAAHDRIEELRKTDFDVTVVDADGDPVEGATVDVAMQEHDFGFGTAVAVNQLPDGDETYRETLRENFNKAVPENGLKVPAWEGRYGESLGPESTREALQWLRDEGIPTRGHALVWSTYDWMGIDSSLSASEINSQVQSKIAERATEFQGQLPEWDMHNHPLFYSEIWDDVGRDAVLDWWETAHDADPNARMYVNEMNVLAGDSLRQDYLDHVQWLQDEGADVEGIGFMGHFGLGGLTPPEELLATFDDFAEFDAPLQVTEFDVEINDRGRDNEVAAQRDYVRDLLTAAFSHEAVDGVMSWGFWADEHWLPTAAYYDSDWTLRPHGEQFQRLVFDEWWTDVTGTTDADGVFAGRGFKGEYRIRARRGAEYGTATVTFDDDGASATVEVSPVSVGDVDLAVDQQVLRGDDTDVVEPTLFDRDGDELPVPDGAVTYESEDPEVLAVTEDGVVSAVGTGTGTVSVTVSAYGDTAIASVEFAADAGPAVVDTAADLSVADSSSGVFAGSYAERHGDGTFFQKNDAGASGSLTYHVEGGVHSVRTVAYVNNAESNGDVFDELVFETSPDGESFTRIDVEHTTLEAPSDANGYWALWEYELQDAIPEDATTLRVTIPETENAWSVLVGRVEIRDAPPVEDPTAPVISDPAADFSLATSRDGLSAASYEERHDDGNWFEKTAADASGSVTYAVEDGITSFRVRAYVNNAEIDGDGDVFEDLEFAVSADGSTYEPLDVEGESTIPPSGDNGYWALWTYEADSAIPDDATSLRITIPETQNAWAVNVGSVEVWSVDATDTDQTGPAIVVDDLQAGRTYEAPRAADVSILDDQTEVTARSVTLTGDAWDGGEIRARGRHRLSASATNAAGVATATSLEFEVVNEDHDLHARQHPSETDATYRDRITFDVEDTTGDDDWITDLAWDFDDGTTAEGWWAEHRFDEPGPYTVELAATDDDGDTTTDAVVLWMSELEELIASAQPSTTEASVGERITFDVVDETGSDSWIDSLAWDFGDGDTAEGWWAEHRYDEAGEYTVALTATDDVGRTATHEVTIAVTE